MNYDPGLDSRTTDARYVDNGPVEFHAALAALNLRRLAPAFPNGAADRFSADSDLLAAEWRWLESERRRQRTRASAAPASPQAFLAWMDDLKITGPGQGDPLFDYLAEQATMDEMRWFLAQEISGEAGFDDLVALTQVRFPKRAKLEMARNYWDEMGRGNIKGMHGPMLEVLADALHVKAASDPPIWEAPALNNLMVGLAINRSYAYHAVGALGAIELTAPGRAQKVGIGLRRLGVSAKVRHYFDLHAVLDVKHAAAWHTEVYATIVEDCPEAASAIAEGALMRLYRGKQCFDRYRAAFGRAAEG